MRQQLFNTAAFAHRGGLFPRSLGESAPAGRLFDPAPFAASRPATAESVGSVMGGTQHKMFMTPTEIHAGWSPLDGDREEGGYSGWGTSSGDLTAASRNPAGDYNSFRTHTTGGAPQYKRASSGVESDEQLWDRKLEESQEFTKHGQYEDADSDPLRKIHGATMGTYEGEASVATGRSDPSTSAWDRHYGREASWENRRQEARYDQGESLYDSIRAEGVHGPVRLGQQIGSMGKPQIVGGHHRLAAATDINPHRLVPVLHDWSIFSARDEAKKGGYPYS